MTEKRADKTRLKAELQTSPIEIMAALKEAGYSLVRRFTRKGRRLTLYLKPASLLAADGNFRAMETCAALGLHASCRVHAVVPQPILILTVELPLEEPPEGGTTNL